MQRDEMIERAQEMLLYTLPDGRSSREIVADFARAEIRRAVREELESLRAKMLAWGSTSVTERAQGCMYARNVWVAEIDRRLAALGDTEKAASMQLAGRVLERREPGSIPGDTREAGDRDADSGEAKARAVPGAHGAEESAIDRDAQLRAASAPKPVDVFEAFEADAMVIGNRTWAEDARAWFGPLVEALERIEAENSGKWDCTPSIIAKEALSELRRKAQEASRG